MLDWKRLHPFMKPYKFLIVFGLCISADQSGWCQSSSDGDIYGIKTVQELVKKGLFSQARRSALDQLQDLDQAGGGNTVEYAYLLAGLGDLYFDRMEYAIAKDLYDKTVWVFDQFPDERHTKAYNELKIRQAITEAKLNNNLSAIVALNQARVISEERFGPNHPETIKTILQLALVYTQIASYKKAGSLYEEIESLWAQSGSNNNDTVFNQFIIDKSMFLHVSGTSGDAIQLRRDALSRIENQLGVESYEYVRTYVEYAGMLSKVEGSEESLQVLENAVELAENFMGPHHSILLGAKENLAIKYWSVGKGMKALQLLDEILMERLKQYILFQKILLVQEKSLYLAHLKYLFELYASLTETYAIEDQVVLAKTLDHWLSIRHLSLVDDRQLEEESNYSTLRDSREILYHFYQLPASVVGAKQVRKQEAESRKLEEKLLLRSSPELGGIHWKDVAATIPDGAVALEVIRYRVFSPREWEFQNATHYGFISFDNSGEDLQLGIELNGVELESKYLTYFRSSIKHRFIDDYAYSIYWSPLKPQIEQYKKIIFSPSGVYRQVNLIAMRNPETHNFLIDEKDVEYVVSTADLLLPPFPPGQKQKEVFIFGNPELKNGSHGENTDQSSEIITPQSASGMKYIRAQLWKHMQWSELLYQDDVKKHEVGLLEPLYESSGFTTSSFTDWEASEMNLKALVYPYLLHLSLHGFFMEDDESGPGGYRDNPLLQSGLILSGSFDFLEGSAEHNTLNDGVLTTYEINHLDLSRTELVFMSSCETGLGIVQNGESIYHFQNAFQSSGARSLIMTMWTTEAEYEIEFMNLFYFHWLLGNMKKREAFTEAQRAMKEAYERPYYWGAFIYIGE